MCGRFRQRAGVLLVLSELFRLTWLGRQDAAVLAMGLVLVMILLRVLTALKWRGEREEEKRWA